MARRCGPKWRAEEEGSSVMGHKSCGGAMASQPLRRFRVIVWRPGFLPGRGGRRGLLRRRGLGAGGATLGAAAMGISIWPAA